MLKNCFKYRLSQIKSVNTDLSEGPHITVRDKMPRQVSIRATDFDLFDQDLSPSDYEFFKKHTGAFKRMLEDQVRAILAILA